MKVDCFVNMIFCVAAILAATVASAHEGDVAIQIIDNKIVVGDWIVDGVSLEPCPVFAGRFNDTGENPNWTDEPGFDSAKNTWTYPSSNYFNILGAARLWNGSNINTLASQRIQMSYGGNSIVSPTDSSVVSGLSIGVSSDGSWHKHVGFTLVDSSYTNGFAADGIYVLPLELLSTNASLTKSDPFYIVLRQDEVAGDGIGTLEQCEAAVAYLENVPEPGTIVMLITACAAGAVGFVRRKLAVVKNS
jgi:hypothetical protein